jgi:uncharacterized pyridoxamine 5'-phosphate oxidase family protein
VTLEEQKSVILEFLKKESLAVASTVDDQTNKPESAVLRFSQTDRLEIIFDTFSTYRKYKNLQTNQNVSLVIGWDNGTTVQYEGIARELRGAELEDGKKIHISKLPAHAKYKEMSVVRYFIVKPTWIRYSNLSVNPWNVFEVDKF